MLELGPTGKTTSLTEQRAKLQKKIREFMIYERLGRPLRKTTGVS